jgi:hypothetical protein
MKQELAFYLDEGNPTLTQKVKGLCEARGLPIETDVESQVIKGYWVTEEVLYDAVAEIEAEEDQQRAEFRHTTLVDVPVERYKKLWMSLYQYGHVRSFNSTRFKIIRDWFSQRGQINWIENHYYVGVEKGEKGHCCRWSVSKEIKEFVGEIVESKTHTPSVLTQIITTPKHVHFTPVFGGTVLDRRRKWIREAENSLDWLYAA